MKDNNIEIRGMGGFGDYIHNSFNMYCRNIIHLLLTKYYRKKFVKDKSIDNLTKKISSKSKRLHLLDSAKHAIVLEQLVSFNALKDGMTICIIGDGYGYFGNLLSAFNSSVKIVFVNLGKQLIFDAQITKNINPNADFKLLSKDNINDKLCSFNYLEAENYNLISNLNIDLFINIASMQEMNKATVDNYFKYMRDSKSSEKFFYCCNRIHKTLPDGEHIIFDEYPWNDSTNLFEEIPQWYAHFTAQRPPFWRPFDGKFKVRFVKL
ncbi:putative sugar O-methyltransferase [Bacteriovorax sp. Seq25_V]|uniref:putative sugar O-methyltransferase n=1 Tax=Bacteriovorax sp. Seq25_V TaxID=1201288 RepID=UPI0012F9CFAE|nr:putative sugar O-methyltransferase [Bacteriovorax sp. Seq25_V]